MKTSRGVSLILLVTAISVFYVWQQTEIVKLAYEKDKKAKYCRKVTDNNMALKYNVLRLSSSPNLNRNLDIFDKGYDIPGFSQIVDLRTVSDREDLALLNGGPALSGRSNIFLSLFTPKSEAQAQTK